MEKTNNFLNNQRYTISLKLKEKVIKKTIYKFETFLIPFMIVLPIASFGGFVLFVFHDIKLDYSNSILLTLFILIFSGILSLTYIIYKKFNYIEEKVYDVFKIRGNKNINEASYLISRSAKSYLMYGIKNKK